MARIVVVGGTGNAGRRVVAEAARRGHEVTVAARHAESIAEAGRTAGANYLNADVMTTDGLEAVLEHQDVLIDTTDGSKRSARPVLGIGSQNLLHAAARWGVHHAVLLSIAGVAESAFSYYRAKAAQEDTYRQSILETRIVAATQFHDLASALFASGRRVGVIPAARRVRLQTIATTDVALALVDAAEGAGEPNGTTPIGGPQIHTMHELAETYKRCTGARGAIVDLPVPGALGATWRSGAVLVPDNRFGTISFGQWLVAATGRPAGAE